MEDVEMTKGDACERHNTEISQERNLNIRTMVKERYRLRNKRARRTGSRQ